MKCTWPTRRFCIGDPMQPIFNWLELGFCLGGNANFIFRVKGLVINYGEGGATKWENRGSETFRAPPIKIG